MANPRETTISYSEVDTMNVVWKYLDKRAGAVAALKDFGSMKFIIENTDDEIKAAYDKMSSVSGVRYDGMPHVRNLHAAEDRIINAIEEIDVLKERYRQAVEYMAANYRDPELTMEKLCGQLHISPSYFSVLFKRETKKTFVQYLTELRMDKAMSLLTGTEMKTVQIAQEVGIPDPSYFSYSFKKSFGISPSQARKREGATL